MELTGVPQVRILKKRAAPFLVFLQGTPLLVAPAAELTLVRLLH